MNAADLDLVVRARRAVVGADEVLPPGLVDTHVHVNEPAGRFLRRTES